MNAVRRWYVSNPRALNHPKMQCVFKLLLAPGTQCVVSIRNMFAGLGEPSTPGVERPPPPPPQIRSHSHTLVDDSSRSKAQSEPDTNQATTVCTVKPKLSGGWDVLALCRPRVVSAHDWADISVLGRPATRRSGTLASIPGCRAHQCRPQLDQNVCFVSQIYTMQGEASSIIR